MKIPIKVNDLFLHCIIYVKKVSRPIPRQFETRKNAKLNVLMSEIIQIRQQLILFKLAMIGILFDVNRVKGHFNTYLFVV